MSDAQSNLIELSAEIVASYVANNSVPATDIASLISNVHAALINASTANVSELTPERTPAVPIKKSIRPDSIICLEDWRAFKSLKRHLHTKYNLSPEEYRRSGVSHQTIQWLLPTTLPRDRGSLRTWVWDNNEGRRRRRSRL